MLYTCFQRKVTEASCTCTISSGSGRLKRDPAHEEIMKTRRRFMDEEEGMDYEEAADAAVDRRKFLLNRIFQPRPVPKSEEEEKGEEEEEEEEDEEDKESWPWDCAVNRVGHRWNCVVTNVKKSDCHVNSPRLLLLQLLPWEMFMFELLEATVSCL